MSERPDLLNQPRLLIGSRNAQALYDYALDLEARLREKERLWQAADRLHDEALVRLREKEKDADEMERFAIRATNDAGRFQAAMRKAYRDLQAGQPGDAEYILRAALSDEGSSE